MRTFLVILFVMITVLITADYGFSQDSGAEEKITAIQEKIYHRYHELSVMTGYMGDDYFYKVYPVGLAYTYNFDDHFSWEVLRGYINLTTQRPLKEDLENNYGVTPEFFNEPKGMLLSHLVLRPFYGKSAVWNMGIINHETYFFLGGGAEFYTQNHSYGPPTDEVSPALSFGAGIKYFINENLNMSVEIHDMVTSRDDEVENKVWVGLNFGFRFNFSESKTLMKDAVKSFTGYIEE